MEDNRPPGHCPSSSTKYRKLGPSLLLLLLLQEFISRNFIGSVFVFFLYFKAITTITIIHKNLVRHIIIIMICRCICKCASCITKIDKNFITETSPPALSICCIEFGFVFVRCRQSFGDFMRSFDSPTRSVVTNTSIA